MSGDDDEMFMTRSLNVTPKTTEQQLHAMINLQPTQLTIKDSARRFVLLKLTTDRHEALRGLSATAEPVVQFQLALVFCGKNSRKAPRTSDFMSGYLSVCLSVCLRVSCFSYLCIVSNGLTIFSSHSIALPGPLNTGEFENFNGNSLLMRTV